jgi:hypothetical protein
MKVVVIRIGVAFARLIVQPSASHCLSIGCKCSVIQALNMLMWAVAISRNISITMVSKGPRSRLFGRNLDTWHEISFTTIACHTSDLPYVCAYTPQIFLSTIVQERHSCCSEGLHFGHQLSKRVRRKAWGAWTMMNYSMSLSRVETSSCGTLC